MCWPHFDSPSVFCRILDKDKGGHFSISPTKDEPCTTKQRYLPSSNILQTRYLKEDGVMNLIDCKLTWNPQVPVVFKIRVLRMNSSFDKR